MPIGDIFKNLFAGGASTLVKDVGTQIRSFVTTKGDVMNNEASMKELDEKILEVTNAHMEKMSALAQEGINAELKDMQDARAREIAIANSEKVPYLNKILTPLLALGVTVLCFALWYIVVFKDIPQTKHIIVGGITGSVTTILVQVLSYYFGSSSGSKAKTDQLNQMLNK